MSRRLFLIANPVAGRGAALRALSRVHAVLDAAGADYRVALTAGRGHATQLAARAVADGWDAVVAVGGDGTVHEVANGALGAGSALFGVVPLGSGNDFAHAAGVPISPLEATARLLTGEPHAVDAGRVGDRWFVNGVGIGLDARVAVEANRVRRLRGVGMYLWALARVLPGYRAPHMEVTVDGAPWLDRPLTLITIGNGPRQGGGFRMNPGAILDDGLLDLCACDALSTPRVLRFLPHTLRGTHVGLAGVHCIRGRRVEVASRDSLAIHADGEVVAEDARGAVIEIHPGRLTLIR
jgi:diacylglycerol kinase (ATP)